MVTNNRVAVDSETDMSAEEDALFNDPVKIFNELGVLVNESILDVFMLDIEDLHPFGANFEHGAAHPFRPYTNEKLFDLANSIQRNGIINPITVRRMKNGDGYEIISGHNRVAAAKIVKCTRVPGMVKNIDDDDAIVMMVDSNLQSREKLFPSEKAFAYRYMLEAIKRKTGRPTKENGGQVDPQSKKAKSRDIVSEQVGESGKQINRYIRITHLLEPLLNMVDSGYLAFNSAVMLSYLDGVQQSLLLQIINRDGIFPTVEQAERLKELSQSKKLESLSAIDSVLHASSSKEKTLFSNTYQKELRKYFPAEYDVSAMQRVIKDLLERWKNEY